jgi:hypothetical protein
MSRPRQSAGLWVAGIFALIAFGIFLLINPRQPETRHGVFAIPTPISEPISDRVERLERVPAPTPHPPAAPQPAPRRQLTQPLAPAAIKALTDRYYAIQAQEEAASAIVKAHLEKDPESIKVTEAKLDELETPLWPISLAQALDDPSLRPVLLEVINKNPLILDGINQRMSRKGLSMARNANEAAAFLKAAESSYQDDYRRLVAKFAVDEELAQAFAQSQASKTLMRYLQGYLFDQGYNYSPDRKTFEAIKQR